MGVNAPDEPVILEPAGESQPEGVPTMIESDAPGEPLRERITAVEARRPAMSESDRADRAELELAAIKAAQAIHADKPMLTSKQIGILSSIIIAVLTALGGSNYLTVSSQVDAHVDDKVASKVIEDTAAAKEEHRKAVEGELNKVMLKVNERAESERKEFKAAIKAISDSVGALDKRMAEQERKDADQVRAIGALERKLGDIKIQQTVSTAEIIKAIEATQAP